MNTGKIRELADAIRGEMRMGITAQRLAVLTVDALDTIWQGAEPAVGRVRGRAQEALIRESAIWILEDIEVRMSRTGATREEKILTITNSLRRLLERIGG